MSIDRGRTMLGIALAVALAFEATPLALSAEPPSMAGSFHAAGSMVEARVGHTVTTLADGRVLIVGGRGPSEVLDSAEVWDPASGTSTFTGPMNDPRTGHTATLLPDGRVLVVGGSARKALATAEVWDPATGVFDPTGKLDGARSRHTATLLADGRVLVVGGYGDDVLATAEIWDPATGVFEPTGDLRRARSSHTATLLADGQVLVVGGRSIAEHSHASAELWDPARRSFGLAGTMDVSREGQTATLLADGRVLLVGGATYVGVVGLTPWETAELWDPIAARFDLTGSMHDARTDHTATLLPDGRVLVVGGDGTERRTAGSQTSSAEIWAPGSAAFEPTGSMREARSSQVAAALADARVLVAGGGRWDDDDNEYMALDSIELWEGPAAPTGQASRATPATGVEPTPYPTPRLTKDDIEAELKTMIDGASWKPYRKSPAGAAFDPFAFGARTGVLFDELSSELHRSVDYAVLFRFDDASDLERYWAERARAAAKQAPLREGACQSGQPGQGTWEGGAYLCYVSDAGNALLRWTDEATNTYGVMNATPGRTNLTTLYRQWQAALGGGVTEQRAAAATKAGFNAAEAVLLEAVPAAIRKTCVPQRGQNPAGTVAAVRCKPRDPTVRSITYHLMEDADAELALERRLRQHIKRNDVEACWNGKPGYSFGTPWGDLVCHRDDDGRANLWVSWSAASCPPINAGGVTLVNPVVYVAIVGKDRDLAALWEWVDERTWGDGPRLITSIDRC